MKVSGTIQIDSRRQTVTIKLANGSYCVDYFSNGVKSFIDEEMECLKHQERDELHTQVLRLIGE
jgi:hypothetical protein